jgi:hypothetical protein
MDSLIEAAIAADRHSSGDPVDNGDGDNSGEE